MSDFESIVGGLVNDLVAQERAELAAMAEVAETRPDAGGLLVLQWPLSWKISQDTRVPWGRIFVLSLQEGEESPTGPFPVPEDWFEIPNEPSP